MAQRKKDIIRELIISEALKEFAINGYSKAIISTIAKSAGIATGNIYHYFKSKEALFLSIIPASFLNHILEIINQKINAINGVENIYLLPDNSEFQIISEHMLNFIIENRLKMIVVTTGLEGSPHEGFDKTIIQCVHRLALAYYQSIMPGFCLSAQQSFNLLSVYKNLFRSLSDIMLHFTDQHELRESLKTHIKYHQGGLRNIFK